MKLARRLILITSAALSLLLATAWARSFFRCDSVSWPGKDRVERNASFAEGQMGAWIYREMTSAVFSSRGALAVTSSEYTSIGGDREELVSQCSRSDRGLKWDAGDSTNIRGRNPPRFWRGISEWRLARFGVYTTARLNDTGRVVECPYWFLVLVASAPGLMLGVPAWKRRRRVAQARCTACGYPVGVAECCTECGAPLPRPAESR